MKDHGTVYKLRKNGKYWTKSSSYAYQAARARWVPAPNGKMWQRRGAAEQEARISGGEVVELRLIEGRLPEVCPECTGDY